jgi:hypothetical protein
MQPFERFFPRAIMAPDNLAGASGSHVWTDVGGARGFLWVVLTGSSDATGMVLRPQQATSQAGTGAKDIPGKVVTVADPGTDNRAHTIALLPEEMDTAAGYRFARLRVEVTGGTTVSMATVFIGCDGRFGSLVDERPAEILAPVV